MAVKDGVGQCGMSVVLGGLFSLMYRVLPTAHGYKPLPILLVSIKDTGPL